MNSKDKIVKKSDLLLQVLLHAQKNKIDLNNRDEIKKIIKFLNLSIAHEELEQFIKLVQDADTFMEIAERNRESKKKKQIN